MKISKNSIEAIVMPLMIELKENFFALSYSLMKLLPAMYILDRAEIEGSLKYGMTIIETSSGTFGLGLAKICAIKGYNLIIVGDAAIDDNLKRRLENLGATVEIVQEQDGISIQEARLIRMNELRSEYPNNFWPAQYDNPNNPASYHLVSKMIQKEFSNVDFIVGPVGSGGSMSGTASSLREIYPDVRAIGVDTHGSILFGQKNGVRKLRGLGNSIMPKNLDHSQFDEIHWMSAADAFGSTLELHKDYALYAGPTSGASFKVGNYLSDLFPDRTVLSIFPDEGYRYEATVYNEAWVTANGFAVQKENHTPLEVAHPYDAKSDEWNFLKWNRKSINDFK